MSRRDVQPVGTGRLLQRAVAPGLPGRQRIVRPPPRANAEAQELVVQPGGTFAMRSAERHTLVRPSGTFNFVRVEGETSRTRATLMSSGLPHAQIAAGRPVVYAGTARFDSGAMDWWSNYSGTYQPIDAFRSRAGLPEDKFVPWQRLALGGVAMQRGAFTERRTAAPPPTPQKREVTNGHTASAPPKPAAPIAVPPSREPTAANVATPKTSR
ncbi:hypothetical protein [Sphingomonas sp. 37zxx]|uniref:hypothetical protein n=1 Tax=Sphingomonas sp. 37zxx TaxID=1550073 RepID=UPI00053BE224|nr:hypothetical protein [Sphingomonas sp. 37zxx]